MTRADHLLQVSRVRASLLACPARSQDRPAKATTLKTDTRSEH